MHPKFGVPTIHLHNYNQADRGPTDSVLYDRLKTSRVFFFQFCDRTEVAIIHKKI
jgi:hypothetical protein